MYIGEKKKRRKIYKWVKNKNNEILIYLKRINKKFYKFIKDKIKKI